MEKSGAHRIFETHLSHNVTEDGRIKRHLTPLRKPGPEVSGNDPRIREAVEVLEGGGQRQDPVLSQLQDVRALAIAAGCYDADDILLKWLEDRREAQRQTVQRFQG